ncbi:DUF6881 domain-containing protein [Erythrobacter sp. EC-HK427]|uniref:DUF6881 domain-containing protein n=1 Tax=Erythrobacter sp. EC-HK427 TaxID=2038396 RepID=UPI001252734D|nr:hypothetical protein [Erythrobacter sp. EC-HK427]VVT06081.1 conserved hypothetical protein [Erythrobacter sp. EC-HK427]
MVEGTYKFFVGEWRHTNPEEPVRFYYEVDAAGNVTRMIEIFADGRVSTDAISSYPDGASPFAFGSLIGCSFWEIPIGKTDADYFVLEIKSGDFEKHWQGAAA